MADEVIQENVEKPAETVEDSPAITPIVQLSALDETPAEPPKTDTPPVDVPKEDAQPPEKKESERAKDEKSQAKPAEKKESEGTKDEKSQAKPAAKEPLSDFPLADSKIMAELKEADAKAKKTAQIIEAMKQELATLAQKEKMTNEDAKMIEQKQAELMEKLSEFEQITTQVQQLVGLTDVTSKMMVDQKVLQRRPPADAVPEDSLPKVIICGGGTIDPVPKIIVCEPTNRTGCGQPLYQQLTGRSSRSSRKAGRRQEKPCKDMTSDCPPKSFTQQQPQSMPWGGNAGAGCWGGTSEYQWQQQQVFQFGQMGALPPPQAGYHTPTSSRCKDSTQPTVIRIATPVACSSSSQTSYASASGDATEDEKDVKKKKKEKEDGDGPKTVQNAELKKKIGTLQNELNMVRETNVNLKKKLGAGKTVELCKAEIATSEVCKADIYRQMGIPLPTSFVQGESCRSNQDAILYKAEPKGGGTCPEICQQKNLAGLGQQKNAQSMHMENLVQQMQVEVRAIQQELEMVQAERRGLELQKKLLTCTAAAPMKPGVTSDLTARSSGPHIGVTVPLPGVIKPLPITLPEGAKPVCPNTGTTCQQEQTLGPQSPCKKQVHHMASTRSSPALKVVGPPLPPPQSSPPCVVALEEQLSSLREQYRKLQCDFNCKVEEVSILRCELESAKRESLSTLEKCQEAESRVDDLLERLRSVEAEKHEVNGSKDHMMEVEQQLTLAKQRYRESQEELEESRINLHETCGALEDYRNKYLNAQQTVEEQRRQLDIMEIENNRISEHINMEIKRIKAQFQEKLEELTPLSEKLKLSHQKLHECLQLKSLAERSVEQLNKELCDLKAENGKLMKQLEDFKKGYSANDAEKANLQSNLNSGEKKLEEIKAENGKLKSTVTRLEELALGKDRRLDEKVHEVLQLNNQLETLREESARQVSRTKDRCESVRRTLQAQISDLERQLAQSRAAARTAQMDRDEIRAKMQTQIQCLNENFNQAQLRIQGLQNNVNYLKNSYTNIFAPQRPNVGPLPLDICGQAP